MSCRARHYKQRELQMKENLIDTDGFVSAFSQQRQVLLKHTADLLAADTNRVRQQTIEREAKLSAILVSSLEELKVAEEELSERVESMAEIRDQLEQRIQGAQQLFDLAPAPLLVTDIYGTISEANRASQLLLKRDFMMLERQPLARFIPVDERRAFRDGLARLIETNGVSDWRLLLIRPTAAPIVVSAAVQVAKSIGSDQQKLFWSLRVVNAEKVADA
jgi:PAS domain-containing protein